MSYFNKHITLKHVEIHNVLSDMTNSEQEEKYNQLPFLMYGSDS